MVRLAGKHAFLELLRDEGVEYLFGNPGSTELALMDALAVESKPHFVLGLHEGVVMSMAHGFATATGKLAAVNLHAAPGLGNALGMLYNVKKANAPVLVTAGQQDLSIAAREPLIWGDLATMARPFVKWSVEVGRLADLPRILRRAAKTAMASPTGPVFVSLPGDILAEVGDIDMLSSTRVGNANRGDAEGIARAAAMICLSRQPIMFVGDAVCSSRAHSYVVRLAQLIGAPVYLEAMADRAAFPTSHALFAGTVPRLATSVRSIIENHDLIISIGADLFTESLATGIDPLPPNKPIVHLDNDVWELGKNYGTQAAILGDPAASLSELIVAVQENLSSDARSLIDRRRTIVQASTERRRRELLERAKGLSQESPIAPLGLLQALGELLPTDAILVDESLSSGTHLTDFVSLDDEYAYMGLRGGGIGAGLPQAIGAKLGSPNRPVVALVGDGSAMFSIQALWTAAHEKVAVTFVILNNRSYRILKQRTMALEGHSMRTGKLIGMDLTDPAVDFISLSKALGVEALRVTTLAEFRCEFSASIAAHSPRLIEVVMDATL